MRNKYSARITLSFNKSTGKLMGILNLKTLTKKYGADLVCDVINEASHIAGLEFLKEIRKAEKENKKMFGGKLR